MTTETITLISRNGLAVTLPQSDYGQYLAVCGSIEKTRERVLSDAGRALKHRRTLAQFYAQELSDEQRQQVDQVARAMVRQDAIYEAASELGYGPYVDRKISGRPTNDAKWERIVARATEWAGQIDDTPSDSYISVAMYELGLMTEDDAGYSRRFTEPTWGISAPDGWNGQLAAAPEATE